MLDININTSSVNKVNAKVELYSGSTLVETCTCNDKLQSFTVERIGVNNKFFGFGIAHKITIVLIDFNKELNITKDHTFKAYLGYDTFVSPYPIFHVDTATRDETGDLVTVVAYDKLYYANTHTVAEIAAPYTLGTFVAAAGSLLGVAGVKYEGVYDNIFDINYPSGANFEGTEQLRDALNAVAEATQTIYFLNKNEYLVFKRLDKDGLTVHTISRNDYYDLERGETKVLAVITDTNELGNDTSVEVDGVTGVIQYVRDNPFWELREDIETLLVRAGTAIGGIAATPFYCDWDGDFRLEIGDKIAITAEDNSEIISYLLNDTVRYDGIMAQATQFIYDGKEETASNPLSLGEKLKQTYAKVDKQNKQIELVVSDVSQNKSDIASLTLDVNGIKLAIESLEDASVGDLTKLTGRITQLEVTQGEITASVTEMQTSVEDVEENVKTMGTELGMVETDLGGVKSTVSGLVTTTGGLRTDLTSLSGTVTTNSTNIGTLTTTTNEISGKVSAVETKVTTLEDDLDDAQATISENSTKIGELTATTESITASVSSISNKTTALETKTGSLETGLTQANSKITSNTTAIGQLQVTTESISAEVSSVKEDTQELTTSLTTLEGTVEQNTTNISTNTANVSSLITSVSGISANVSSLQTTTQTHATYINNINGDITEIKNTNTTQSEKIAALELTDESISASVSSLTSTTETHTKTLSDYNDRFINNEDDIANLQTDTIDLEDAMNQANIAITTNIEKISSLEMADSSITATVSTLETTTKQQIGSLEDNYTDLSEQVAELKLTDSALTLDIKNIHDNGVDKVTTSTGFTFNDEGLTIEKSDSDISTNINEDGLSVYKYNDEVLTADNQGVKAQNLTAREYLIIGTNTYITDYTDENGNSRAGVFWNGD